MRKYYLDNIKWFVIVLVLVNHVVSIFSSNGSLMSYNAKGIASMDAIGYFIYPWFMPILFVIAIIKLLNGMGPSWFLLQLFLLSYVLLLVRRLDKKEKLFWLGKQCNLRMLLLLYFPVLLAAQILYVAFTFRNGLYLLLFLLGYYMFSEERVQNLLEKWNAYFLLVGFLAGILQCYVSWGKPYQEVVNHWLVMLYTWFMILGVMGCAGRWFNQNNKLTRYMRQRSFGLYLFHYVPMVYIAYYLTTNFKLPDIVNYIVVLILSFAASIILFEILVRIPVVNLILGLKKKN